MKQALILMLVSIAEIDRGIALPPQRAMKLAVVTEGDGLSSQQEREIRACAEKHFLRKVTGPGKVSYVIRSGRASKGDDLFSKCITPSLPKNYNGEITISAPIVRNQRQVEVEEGIRRNWQAITDCVTGRQSTTIDVTLQISSDGAVVDAELSEGLISRDSWQCIVVELKQLALPHRNESASIRIRLTLPGTPQIYFP